MGEVKRTYMENAWTNDEAQGLQREKCQYVGISEWSPRSWAMRDVMSDNTLKNGGLAIL